MISVSIIEDHANYRKSLIKLIEESDELVMSSVYSSAEEALLSLIADAPDIAIVDIQLKTISGIELVQQIKPRLPDTQFLMCTSFENNENVFNALKAGATGYIVKGSTAEEIRNAVIELHNGGSPMSPYIARKVITLMHKKDDSNNYGLSERELEVISLLSIGFLYKEISDRLDISINTVKNHCKNIYKRLYVQNRTEAINKYRAL